MQYDQLRAKGDDCEIWFEGFFDGYPRYRGKFKEVFDTDKYGQCEHVKNFFLEYLPVGKCNLYPRWRLISPVDRRCSEILAYVKDPSDPKYQITLPGEYVTWVPEYLTSPVVVKIIEVVRRLSRVVQRIRPFSWKGFLLSRMDQREHIRFTYLCFYRLFDMLNIRLPEESLNHILSFNNIILE